MTGPPDDLYRFLIDHVSHVVFQADAEGRWTFLSPAWTHLTGRAVEDSLGESFLEGVHPDDVDEFREKALAAPDELWHEVRYVRIDGEPRWVSVAAQLRRDEGGQVSWAAGTLTDVTDRHRAEQEARTAERRLTAAFDTAATGMALTDLDGVYVRVNHALAEITGRPSEELPGTSFLSITHPDDRSEDERVLAALRGGSPTQHREKRYLRPDGSTVWVEVHLSVVHDADNRPEYVLAQVSDISERRAMEERLRHLADHDGLTGLYNRRRFEEELERHVSHGHRYGMRGALLLIDVDELKRVNDTGGHKLGDRVLTSVAGVLGGRLRETDVLARIGGDEFAVLLPHATRADAAAVGQVLAEAVSAEVSTPDGSITVSVGSAAFGEETESADEVLSAADASMYRHKRRDD